MLKKLKLVITVAKNLRLVYTVKVSVMTVGKFYVLKDLQEMLEGTDSVLKDLFKRGQHVEPTMLHDVGRKSRSSNTVFKPLTMLDRDAGTKGAEGGARGGGKGVLSVYNCRFN